MFQYFLLSLFCSQLFTLSKGENVCGDWETYREEKCIKIMDKTPLQSFKDAEKTCTTANADSKLISIFNADEQSFFSNFLFTQKHVVDNIWLSGKLAIKNNFQWKDGSNLTFTNWATGNPKNYSTDACIQMNADEELRGKWSNVQCEKKNLVVCEKRQTWSNAKMQEIVEKMLKNPVPLGFIYVQLPKELGPGEIWPLLTWTDVSAQYDSTFFRVVGSKAKEFGAVQEEALPHIDEIKLNECRGKSCSATQNVKTKSGEWTGDVLTAWFFEGNRNNEFYRGYLNFHMSKEEVRPKNMAVKVWKRTA